MNLRDMTNQQINALFKEVSDEWVRRNTPSSDEIQALMAKVDRVHREFCGKAFGKRQSKSKK